MSKQTKYIVFGAHQGLIESLDYNIEIWGTKLERVNSRKTLGVILDSHLTFDEDIVISTQSRLRSWK